MTSARGAANMDAQLWAENRKLAAHRGACRHPRCACGGYAEMSPAQRWRTNMERREAETLAAVLPRMTAGESVLGRFRDIET